MRDLTEGELSVLEIMRRAYEAYLDLPEVHVADIEEFVINLHALQNIILARPATESINVEE